jgi:hypothetical protein
MILALAMALTAQTAPTLSSIRRLPPRAAGEVALAGQKHGPIETVVPANRTMLAPGHVALEMVERSRSIGVGCARRRWIVGFFSGAQPTAGSAKMTSVYARDEVALRRSSRCPRAGYVHVHGGLERGAALAPLLHLDRIQRGSRKVRFSCVDRTKSRFCGTPASLQLTLAGLKPWAVTQDKKVVKFWLGRAGGREGDAVVELRYSTDDPADISVERRIPAPA